ncbi:ABC transporter ATP-binding protein [Cryobacterium suzukii]|uniref:ABC transporter ATP-binding protein n=1 Tax=Cryobacterium suzukii TaxID=1259198 RepID=A0A4R9ACZ7_9MICO|nr:ABC transporter ATP-binding protein [Cryobacterium suzukii]TFD56762.1 ABC transporter ATP-binding protein [Cryobacterium suzukii]
MRVRLDRVGHAFSNNAHLFTDLSLVLLPGETYALVGPSGSGKSTLLSIVSKWLAPTTGSVTWEGIERQGWVFQNPHGIAHRTALDHVVHPYLAQGNSRVVAEDRARANLQRFGLEGVAHLQFRKLSGGEAQRLMLARGLAADPQLLLIDEPTAQLDTHTAQAVNASIRQLSSPRSIVVVATHDRATQDSCTQRIDLGCFQ